MFIDRFEKALELAKAPTLERIRAEAARMPHRLAKLLTYVADNLCDPALNATSARRVTGVGHSLSAEFRAHTDTTLRVYIETGRLEIADRMLCRTDFEVGRISLAVGYAVYETFLRAYEHWTGERPTEARGEVPGLDIEYAMWRRVCRGRLDPEEARELLAAFRRLYPEADKPRESTEGAVAGDPRPAARGAAASGAPVPVPLAGALRPAAPSLARGGAQGARTRGDDRRAGAGEPGRRRGGLRRAYSRPARPGLGLAGQRAPVGPRFPGGERGVRQGRRPLGPAAGAPGRRGVGGALFLEGDPAAHPAPLRRGAAPARARPRPVSTFGRPRGRGPSPGAACRDACLSGQS
ncbi:MAG: helix-turn-helix transcriptional regulator [bacterium]|nr:helix-turn-helix transcriptional regulator [bacterium]